MCCLVWVSRHASECENVCLCSPLFWYLRGMVDASAEVRQQKSLWKGSAVVSLVTPERIYARHIGNSLLSQERFQLTILLLVQEVKRGWPSSTLCVSDGVSGNVSPHMIVLPIRTRNDDRAYDTPCGAWQACQPKARVYTGTNRVCSASSQLIVDTHRNQICVSGERAHNVFVSRKGLFICVFRCTERVPDVLLLMTERLS